MVRTQYFAFASVLCFFACSSKNDEAVNHPDAGKIAYDFSETSQSGSSSSSSPTGSSSTNTSKGRDSTGTRGTAGRVGVAKKVVKKRPPRKGRTDTPTRPKEVQGLLAEVFVIDESTTSLPNFSQLDDSLGTFFVANLDVSSRSLAQGFPGFQKSAGQPVAIRFSGSLNIPEGQGGEYSMCFASKDGVELFLEEMSILAHDGIHDSVEEVCEKVFLEPGEYALRIHYFQVSDDIALQWKWSRDNATKETVPSSALFRPDSSA